MSNLRKFYLLGKYFWAVMQDVDELRGTIEHLKTCPEGCTTLTIHECEELAKLLGCDLATEPEIKLCVDCHQAPADGFYDLCKRCLKQLDDEIEARVNLMKKEDE